MEYWSVGKRTRVRPAEFPPQMDRAKRKALKRRQTAFGLTMTPILRYSSTPKPYAQRTTDNWPLTTDN
jgi:hypothetical protein